MKIISASAALALSAVLYSTAPAQALYNKDLKKLPGGELGTYINANVEMLIFTRHQMGDKTGSTCVYKWFYTNGTKAIDTVHAAIKRYPNNTPQAVIFALARKACFNK